MLNHPEFPFGELFVPWNVIIGALGFLNAWLVVTVMEYTGYLVMCGTCPFSSQDWLFYLVH